MAVQIRSTKFLRYIGGKRACEVELDCDELDDLPEIDSFPDVVLAMGSTAHVIGDDTLHELNGSGEWVQQKG